MIWESLIFSGSCEHDESCYGWAEMRTAVTFILMTCGDPPEECVMEVRTHAHELGGYPEIQLGWEQHAEVPENWSYLDAAQSALDALGEHLDWSSLWNDFPKENWLPDPCDDEEECP